MALRRLLPIATFVVLLAGCGVTPAAQAPQSSTTSGPAATTAPAATSVPATQVPPAVESPAPSPASAPSAKPMTQTGNPQACINAFDESVDYFPDKVDVTHSTLWSIAYTNHYKVIRTSIGTLTGGNDTAAPVQQTYVLLQCGAPAPELAGDLANAQIIQIPARRAIATYYEDVTALFELGLADRLIAVPNSQWLVERNKPLPTVVTKAVENGSVAVLAGDTLSVEQVLTLTPDIVFAYSVYGYDDANALQAADIPVVGVLNAAEPLPLGDAEWAKFFAAFFNAEAQANQLFDEVEGQYTALAAKAAAATERPAVMMVSPYSADYLEAHSNSWGARLIEDAGGTNILADDGGTAPVSIGLETFLAAADQAEVWLTEFSLFDLGATRTELSNVPFDRFPSVKTGQVWNIGKVTPAEDRYYGFWSTRPDLLLADLVAVLHPELLPNHEPAVLEPPLDPAGIRR